MIAIGGVTGPEAHAMVAVADDEEKVLISPSAAWPGLTGISSRFFRLAPSGFHEGAKMGNFTAQELGIVRVATLSADSPYARDVRDVFTSQFERHGGVLVAAVEYPAATTELGHPVAQVLAAEPEAVYVTGHAYEVGDVVRQLAEAGFGGRVLTTHAFACAGVRERAGAAAEGVLLTRTVFDPASPQTVVRDFVDAWGEDHGTEPDALAAQAYDAMQVVGTVLERVETVTARDLVQQLRNLHDFYGATGPVQFDERGDVSRFPRVYLVDDGALIDFETVTERRREIQKRLDDLRGRRSAAGVP